MLLIDRVVAAHRAMLAPSGTVDAAVVADAAICTVTAFALCGLVHATVARHFKRTYFALHVFANTVITALTLPGALRALVHAENSTVVANGAIQPNVLYMCWIYALHLYHPLFFKTGAMDWVHHVPVYIVNTLAFSVPCGDAICLQSLVMTGIPGGLEYLLQVLEGEGLLTRAAYKGYSSSINTWLRAPFGALSAYVCFLGMYHGWARTTRGELLAHGLLGVHAAWNPPFFARQAIEANVVDVVNRFTLLGGDLKLPKIRALSSKAAGAGGGAAKAKAS